MMDVEKDRETESEIEQEQVIDRTRQVDDLQLRSSIIACH